MKKVTDTPSPILVAGAKDLINTMKTPAAFLEFITEALTWIYDYKGEIKDETHTHFTLLRIIENIIQPWFAGEKSMIEEMAKGFQELDTMAGYDGYQGDMAILMKAFGEDLQEGYPTPTHLEKIMLGITTLHKIGNVLYVYDNEQKEMKLKTA